MLAKETIMYAIYWLLQWNHAVEKHGWKTPFKSAPAIKCPCHNSFGFSHDHVAPSSTTLNRPNRQETEPSVSKLSQRFLRDQHTCFWWWNLPSSSKSSCWIAIYNQHSHSLSRRGKGSQILKRLRFRYILFFFVFWEIRVKMKWANLIMIVMAA